MEDEISGKRVRLENSREFFALVKESPKYSSWKDLIKNVGCGNTSLKACRRGKRSMSGQAFSTLLNYLTEERKVEIISKIKFLDKNWGASKGGRQSIKNRKERLGEKGFLDSMAEIRENSAIGNLSEWHSKMKKENPVLYSQIQRKRWINLLKSWSAKDPHRKKAIKTLREKYGANYFSVLGLNGAANQQLTMREKLVKESILELGFEICSHKTLSGFNFDFTYEKEGNLKAIEEVLGFRKKKGVLFFDILVLYEKYKTIMQTHNIPFFVSTWYEVDLKYKTERFPLELLIWAFEKGMFPILMDSKEFDSLREGALRNPEYDKSELVAFLNANLQERRNLLRRGAQSQSNQSFDGLEQKIHQKLEQMNLNPQGKKLFKTRHGTFIVSDNYFRMNGTEIAVFVSKGDINGVIGSSALVKELVSPEIKTIGIVLKANKKRKMIRSQNRLLKTYVDYFYNSLEGFEHFSGP